MHPVRTLLLSTATLVLTTVLSADANIEVSADHQAKLFAALSDHVAGVYRVVATVSGIQEEAYCPFRTAQCGKNPTCSHPVRKKQVLELTAGKVTHNPQSLPKPKLHETAPLHQMLKIEKGQQVAYIVYQYKNGSFSPPAAIEAHAAPQS